MERTLQQLLVLCDSYNKFHEILVKSETQAADENMYMTP